MDEPLGLKHWVVIAIVVVLIISLITVARGPVPRVRVVDDGRPAIASEHSA